MLSDEGILHDGLSVSGVHENTGKDEKGMRKRSHLVVQHCTSLVDFTFSLVPRPSIAANAVGRPGKTPT